MTSKLLEAQVRLKKKEMRTTVFSIAIVAAGFALNLKCLSTENSKSGIFQTNNINEKPNLNNMKNDTLNMTITRTFDASLEKVWEAWSSSELVKQWWGPAGFTAPVAKIDFREGGVSLVCMRSPEGFEIYNTWSYKKIIPKERIEFVQHFTDKNGNRLDPASIGLPSGIPYEVPHTITFKVIDNKKTEITIVENGYISLQVVEMSKGGMGQVLDKLQAVLK